MGAIKTFNEFINESNWFDGSDTKKAITTNRDLRKKIEELYKEQGEGDTLDVSSLTNLINRCYDFSCIFKGYRKVVQIIGLEDWDVSHVEDMGGMFGYCYNLNCDLSNWDVSHVQDMDGMFMGCKKFNSDLSKWDVSHVEDMYGMFEGCKNFNSDLSKWDVSLVKNMNYMFYDCGEFNCDLSNWDVSNVKDMRYMFEGCKSLEQIPSWYKNKGLNESILSDMRDRITGGVSYSTLKRKECKVNLLYKYLIDNYEVLGDEEIKVISDKYMGKVYYELEIPITLSGETIVTELTADDMQSIWSIDFKSPLMEYVERMKTVIEIDDGDINNGGYARAYTNTGLVLCSEVVDFIDEILTMVPDPALRKRRK